MKTAVVMTTYNGEKYIIDQLESIRKQTRQPDELVIYDDCSNDDTVIKAIKYIEENELDSWSVIVNSKNLGWKENFIQGINKSEGELIFLADQDDIWKPDKIQIMAQTMEENTDINLLCSNYEILNESGEKIIKNSHLDSENSGTLERVELDEKFHLVGRPGCTYCVRSDFAHKCVLAWRKDYAHDKLLWIAGIMTQTLYRINSALIIYRRHGNNASGKGHQRNRLIRSYYQDLDFQTFNAIKEIYAGELQKETSNCRMNKILEVYEKWSQTRVRNLNRRNLADTIYCIKNVRYYSSVLSLLADIL